jgi:nucleoside-diphosphate-sugar epimerase
VIAGEKILVTGAPGVVARSATLALAENNEVWALGRWTDAGVAKLFRARGIHLVRWDIRAPFALDGVPGCDYVLHAAPFRGLDATDAETVGVNATSVGALMRHCRHAKAFLYVSTVLVYTPLEDDHRHAETDPMGGYAPWNPSYPLGKIAAEGAVRAFAEVLGVPSIVARMGVAYGPDGKGGLPVRIVESVRVGSPVVVGRHVDHLYNPIHVDDIVRQVPLLWDVAAVPAVVVNWGGDDVVAESELIAYAAELTGRTPAIEHRELPTHGGLAFDNTLRQRLVGSCRVGWRDGIAQAINERKLAKHV